MVDNDYYSPQPTSLDVRENQSFNQMLQTYNDQQAAAMRAAIRAANRNPVNVMSKYDATS